MRLPRAFLHLLVTGLAASVCILLMLGTLPAFLQAAAPHSLQSGQEQSKDKTKAQSQQPAPPPAQNSSGSKAGAQQNSQYTINVQSNLIRVDVVVTDKDGNIVTGLTKENFRVLQNNTPQLVTNFTPSDAPITIVMLMEYSRLYFTLASQQGVQWAYIFLNDLKPQDWVALMTYDLHTHIITDFTHDRQEVAAGLSSLMIPSFHEANMFDALIDTLDRLQDVQGKKSILLIGSGADTFSKHTLGKAYNRVKQTDVTIFCVGTAEVMESFMEMNPYLRDPEGQSALFVDYEQDKNELSTFARMTGGYAWFPHFYGEMPDIFRSVAAFLRNQYSLGFVPSGNVNDGKYHKIKVEVVDKNGQPFAVADKKGKMHPVIAYAREGYMAPSSTVGD